MPFSESSAPSVSDTSVSPVGREGGWRSFAGSAIRLEYEKLYRFYNLHFKCWLLATDDLQPHLSQRFLYGGNIEDAGLFNLETPGKAKLKGPIEVNHNVEFCLSNKDKKYQGMAMLLDFCNWVAYVGIDQYSDKEYNWVVYTQVEYGP
ncbi:hypothetical protein N7463_000339 [Penicillium fimorum]|uniref:Uncharacterized protein n=1 Tax=Penicillium fimorum TaxID=1882269 RepID=A0A9W9Y490_9EURO|nr:hypothetical protein N7463_000339 [Penicillium fimorum]